MTELGLFLMVASLTYDKWYALVDDPRMHWQDYVACVSYFGGGLIVFYQGVAGLVEAFL